VGGQIEVKKAHTILYFIFFMHVNIYLTFFTYNWRNNSNTIKKLISDKKWRSRVGQKKVKVFEDVKDAI